MCIIYSSYIQHLTNKQRKTDYWKKHRWKWGTTKVGAFWVQVGSYVCSTLRSHHCLEQLQMLLDKGTLLTMATELEIKCSDEKLAKMKFKMRFTLKTYDQKPTFKNRLGIIRSCLSDGGVSHPGKASAQIPSSSVTKVWSAQTWTLGTVFTHILVTCKPPCRKHKIHLINPPFTSYDCTEGTSWKKKKENHGRNWSLKQLHVARRPKCWEKMCSGWLMCLHFSEQSHASPSTCGRDYRGSDRFPSSRRGNTMGRGGVAMKSSGSSSDRNSSSDVFTHDQKQTRGTHTVIQTPMWRELGGFSSNWANYPS